MTRPFPRRPPRWLVVAYDRPVLDWILVVLPVVVLTVHGRWPTVLAGLDPAARRHVYLATAALSGTLLGLTITSVNLLLGVLDKPLRGRPDGLPRVSVKGLARILFSACLALGALCLASLVAAVADGARLSGRPTVQTLVALVLLVVVARIARVVVSLRLLLLARATPAP